MRPFQRPRRPFIEWETEWERTLLSPTVQRSAKGADANTQRGGEEKKDEEESEWE